MGRTAAERASDSQHRLAVADILLVPVGVYPSLVLENHQRNVARPPTHARNRGVCGLAISWSIFRRIHAPKRYDLWSYPSQNIDPLRVVWSNGKVNRPDDAERYFDD